MRLCKDIENSDIMIKFTTEQFDITSKLSQRCKFILLHLLSQTQARRRSSTTSLLWILR
jgi:hypothetical protein